MIEIRARLALAVIALASVLTACGTRPEGAAPRLAAATGASLAECDGLASRLQLANTRLESSAWVADGVVKMGDRSVPAHCLVKGACMSARAVTGATMPSVLKCGCHATGAAGFITKAMVDWTAQWYPPWGRWAVGPSQAL